MVVLDKYHDEDDLVDTIEPSVHADEAPPSYEAISTDQPNSQPVYPLGEKSPRQPAISIPRSSGMSTSGSPSRPTSNPSTWLSLLSFSSSRPSKQVRQTVHALIRDLVLNAESPDLLGSCANACQTYGLDLAALLQEPSIERHSAIYWAILNRRDTLLPSMLVHAAPLTPLTVSDVRLACLATSNQRLFQSLRCQREPFTKAMTPLSTSPGADALVLGSMPSDEVTIREMEGQGTFVAEMRINLWQKRMRVSGRVSVEFIARGRIWSLTFFSPPSTTRTTVGMWQVALCLLEHSPPTFIDSRLVIDVPPPSSNASATNASRASDLISLSPPNIPSSPAPSPSPPRSHASKSKSKTPPNIQVRLKSSYRLAYRASNIFLGALDAAFSSQKGWSPPHVDQWMDNDGTYTNAIVVPLDDGAGGELLYDNTPFVANDGTLHARLEARLGKPESPECVIC